MKATYVGHCWTPSIMLPSCIRHEPDWCPEQFYVGNWTTATSNNADCSAPALGYRSAGRSSSSDISCDVAAANDCVLNTKIIKIGIRPIEWWIVTPMWTKGWHISKMQLWSLPLSLRVPQDSNQKMVHLFDATNQRERGPQCRKNSERTSQNDEPTQITAFFHQTVRCPCLEIITHIHWACRLHRVQLTAQGLLTPLNGMNFTFLGGWITQGSQDSKRTRKRYCQRWSSSFGKMNN